MLEFRPDPSVHGPMTGTSRTSRNRSTAQECIQNELWCNEKTPPDYRSGHDLLAEHPLAQTSPKQATRNVLALAAA